MQITQIEEKERGSFNIIKDNETLAKMTYTWAGTDRIIIDHTEVSPVLKGQGAGKLLVERAVNFAREKHIKIIPLCPFTKSVLEKTPEWQDIL